MAEKIKYISYIQIFFLLQGSLLYSMQKFTLRTTGKEVSFIAKFALEKKECEEKVSTFSLVLDNGEKIPTIFFDRGKDKVIVVGQGLPGHKEWGRSKARLFHDYDVLLFDYRWKDTCKFVSKFSTLWSPIKSYFLNEKDVVIKVLEFLKNLKKYKEVVGLAECYSNFTFVVAQAELEDKDKGGFTCFILDSCWYDARDFVEEISFDPWLPFEPQEGGAPSWLKKVLKNGVVHWPVSLMLNICTPNLSIKPYLEKISVPILFVHGKNDKMVPLKKVFEKIWKIPTGDKALLITPFEHSDNIQNPLLYKNFCDAFINAKEIEKDLIKYVSTYKI